MDDFDDGFDSRESGFDGHHNNNNVDENATDAVKNNERKVEACQRPCLYAARIKWTISVKNNEANTFIRHSCRTKDLVGFSFLHSIHPDDG